MLYIVISSYVGYIKFYISFFFLTSYVTNVAIVGIIYFKKKHCEDPYVKEPILF